MRGPRTIRLLLAGVAMLPLAASGCDNVACGEGTIERNGKCDPADVTTGAAMCGSGTVLEGNTCVPTIECDPNTTTPVVNPTTGVTTCTGITGASGCSTCPKPSKSDGTLQSVCGQIYDFANNMPFVATGATGAKCTTATTDGPCAIAITAYDALAFATDPMTATPLSVGSMCIDDMGRFALGDIASPSSPEMGIGIDDIAGADMGPPGVTNAVGIAVPKNAAGVGAAISGIEDWIVSSATTTSWQTSGGPSIAGGIFAAVFRAHCVGTGCTGDPFANQAGVMITKSGSPVAGAYYFQAADTTRSTIDGTATVTGANGTGLLLGAALVDGPIYGGTGGITDPNCEWGDLDAATLPGIVTIQVFRKTPMLGKTCTE
ncbi:MAG TPA: hypothetical protein VMJ10_08410 [Kofleriaceae bacterium]|nr:hypothetical protein [Kofleriaceae bacterium]